MFSLPSFSHLFFLFIFLFTPSHTQSCAVQGCEFYNSDLPCQCDRRCFEEFEDDEGTVVSGKDCCDDFWDTCSFESLPPDSGKCEDDADTKQACFGTIIDCASILEAVHDSWGCDYTLVEGRTRIKMRGCYLLDMCAGTCGRCNPSKSPVAAPTVGPSRTPSAMPTPTTPTASPDTSAPSVSPSILPSAAPTTPDPSAAPTIPDPTTAPSTTPSKTPTKAFPTTTPSKSPSTSTPSTTPSRTPSRVPSMSPTGPTAFPTQTPSDFPIIGAKPMVNIVFTIVGITSANFPNATGPIKDALSELTDVHRNDIHVTFEPQSARRQLGETTGKVNVDFECKDVASALQLEDKLDDIPDSVIIDKINEHLNAAGVFDGVYASGLTEPEYVAVPSSNDDSDEAILFGFSLLMIVAMGVGVCCISICCYGMYVSYTNYFDDQFDDGFFSKVGRRVSRVMSLGTPLEITSGSSTKSGKYLASKVEMQSYDADAKRSPRDHMAHSTEYANLAAVRLDPKKSDASSTVTEPGKATPDGMYRGKESTHTRTNDSEAVIEPDRLESMTPKALEVMEELYNDYDKSPSNLERSDDGHLARYDSKVQDPPTPYYDYENREEAVIAPDESSDLPKRKVLRTTTTEIEAQLQHAAIQSGAYLHKSGSGIYGAENEHIDIQSGAYLEKRSPHSPGDNFEQDFGIEAFTPVTLDANETLADVETIFLNN